MKKLIWGYIGTAGHLNQLVNQNKKMTIQIKITKNEKAADGAMIRDTVTEEFADYNEAIKFLNDLWSEDEKFGEAIKN